MLAIANVIVITSFFCYILLLILTRESCLKLGVNNIKHPKGW